MVVFQSVRLVYNQAGPRDGAQDGLIDGDQLVGREQNVELDGSVFLQETSEGSNQTKTTRCIDLLLTAS